MLKGEFSEVCTTESFLFLIIDFFFACGGFHCCVTQDGKVSQLEHVFIRGSKVRCRKHFFLTRACFLFFFHGGHSVIS